MRSVRAEFVKLRRSLSWVVVVLLPLMSVVLGTATTVSDGRALDDGWHTLWLRVVVFQGLFPLAVGIGVLASLVWRVEHQGGNANALLSAPVSGLEIIVGKVTVLAVLIVALQAVQLAAVTAAGALVFDLPGLLPARYLLVSVLTTLAALPVVAVQSALSMLLRSFAAPVAVALAGATASVPLLLAKADTAIAVVPYALLARATQLGTGVFADPGPITGPAVATVVVAAVALTAVIVTVSVLVLERRDVR